MLTSHGRLLRIPWIQRLSRSLTSVRERLRELSRLWPGRSIFYPIVAGPNCFNHQDIRSPILSIDIGPD